jgi:hypothetical protein
MRQFDRRYNCTTSDWKSGGEELELSRKGGDRSTAWAQDGFAPGDELKAPPLVRVASKRPEIDGEQSIGINVSGKLREESQGTDETTSRNRAELPQGGKRRIGKIGIGDRASLNFQRKRS